MNVRKLNIEEFEKQDIDVRLDTPSDLLEFFGQIIDGFEDFLASRGVVLPNPEIEEAIEDGENPDEIALIYGSDYYELEDMLWEVHVNWSKREAK